ncbi:hypothetical protein AAMO2058_000501500 [Amorphochlora amoebiformis]
MTEENERKNLELPPQSEAAKFRQAEWDDLGEEKTLYIRGQKAQVTKVDYPLVYWVFEGERSEKHRSFEFDKDMFKVIVEKKTDTKTSSTEAAQPLVKKVHAVEDDEVDVSGVTVEHSIEISECKAACISILDEAYGVSISKCVGVTVLFTNLGASCDLLDCSGCKVYCMTECCLFDIQDCKDCTVVFGESLLSTVLVSTIKSSAISLTAYEKITAETVEILKDGEDIQTLTEYKIPNTIKEDGSSIEFRTQWNGSARKFESKAVSPEDANKVIESDNFDPFK